MRIPKPEASLKARYPDVAEFWSSKNKLTAEQVFPNSVSIFLWECSTCHYSWEANPNSMVQRPGCSACKGIKFIPGVSSIPSSLLSWSEEDLAAVHRGSKRKVLWSCPECSHQWLQRVFTFVKNPCCPSCVNKTKSLLAMKPELVKEYSPQNDIPVDVLPAGSAKKVWWVCSSCSHEWKTHVYSRTNGSGCPKCAVANRPAQPISVSFADVASDLVKSEWSTTNVGKPSDYSYGSSYKACWVCSSCSHEWKATIVDRATAGYGCPKCVKKISKAENAIYEFLKQYDLVMVRNSRKIIPPLELDLYSPENKVGVEFNGVYWHSEKFKPSAFSHHDKWLAAKQVGVHLIQVWEDDWNRNPELVKRMLAHKLGVSQERVVYARKTVVSSLAKCEAELFLKTNHIQGYASGSYYLGLKDKVTDEVVAVMVLKKEPGSDGRALNLIRYATSANVVGGFTKLLTYAEKTYKPEMFITFADHCVSDGGLYENNGFLADKELPPDYMYVVNGERKHKFGYRLKKFRDDPNLLFEEGLTERELASLNNIPRIWDAGKTRYVKACD